MYHRNAAQVIALVVLAGALLLAPLAQAQGPTPPPPQRGLHYEIDQQGLLPRLPGARPEARAADQANALPDCAPWTRLAFASYRDNNWEVYKAQGDGTGQTRLTNYAGADTAPKFNQGCTRIIYQSRQGDLYEVYAMNTDGSALTRLTNNLANDGIPCWSPDGTRIAFQTDRNGNNEVYVMNADGTGQTNLTNHPAYDGMPAWSPDGTRIAFVSNRTGQYEIWAMNTDGTGQTQVTHGVAWAEYPCWSPDGTKIAFSNDDNGDGFMDVDVVNADGTGFTFLAGHTSNEDYWYPAWSPDGEWIAFGRTALIYYQGHWYWYYSEIIAFGLPEYGHIGGQLVGSGYDWQPHWETLDTEGPSSSVDRLPAYFRAWNLIRWSGVDQGPAGLRSYDVQVRDGANGGWTDWLMGTAATAAAFHGLGGHTYYFRSRARDRAWHVEAWPGGNGDTHTTLYTYVLAGQVRDNRGAPAPGATVHITPSAIEPATTDSAGQYNVHLTAISTHTISSAKNGYGVLPATAWNVLDDVSYDFVLPPADNVVLDGDFESGSLEPHWSSGGNDPPTVVDTLPHTGARAVFLGQPFAATPALNVSHTPDSSDFPRVAVAGSGIVHVVWCEDVPGHYGYDVYYACRGSGGSWSTPQNISHTPQGAQSPQLAVDQSGAVHVVWGDYSTGSIYYARRDSGGTWSSPQNISHGLGSAQNQQLAVDNSGAVHVIWSSYEIYYTRRGTDGTWSSPQKISADLFSFDPQLAVDEQGTAHVVWLVGYDVYYVRRASAGGWSSPQRITANASSLAYSRLAVGPGGIPHVAWCDWRTIYHTQRESDGVWTPPQNIPGYSGDVRGLLLAVDSREDAHIVWEQGNPYTIGYVRRGHDGSWSCPQVISDISRGAERPSLAIDRVGIIHIVWEEPFWNPTRGIGYARRWSDGIWTQPQRISYDGSPESPQVAVDQNGAIHVTWLDSKVGNQEVYYCELAPAEYASDSTIIQAVMITNTMSHPTLSFVYRLDNTEASSGGWFEAKVECGITTTQIFSASTATNGWAHAWADMTPWAGQTVTLTFNVHNEAGTPVTWAYLDEVTLGSAYPNLWVNKTSSTVPPGGGPVRYTITYGNQGGVPAQGVRITDTLPVSVTFASASAPPTSTAPLVWDVGNLAAGAGPYSIIVTATVEAGTPAWTTFTNTVTIGAATPEADRDNNTAVAQTFVGHRLYLPLVMKDW